MRKIISILACTAFLALTACAQGPASGPPVVSTTVDKVTAATKQICGYVPAASTVASIIATFTGGGDIVAIVSQAAQGICGAVTAKGARRGGATPHYRGVKIKGSFVR